MADLKYLGFVIALAAYAQGWFDTALEVYSTGRKFLPGVADTVLQSAEDVSVTLFLFFVAPVVSKTRKTATTILEWIDEKLDQRVVFVVEFYETAKNDVGLFVDRLKETHGERLKSFVAAREAVSSEFANLAEALKENGVWGGFTHMLGALGEYLGAATAALQTTAQNVSGLNLAAAVVSRCKDIWCEFFDLVEKNPLVIMVKSLLQPLIMAGIGSLKILMRMVYNTVVKMVAPLAALWNAAIAKFDALVDAVVASPTYAKLINILCGAIAWIWHFTLVQKIYSLVVPYAMPLIELIEGNQLLHDIVERLTPVKQD